MATPFEQRIIRDVDEYGWFGMSVGRRKDSNDAVFDDGNDIRLSCTNSANWFARYREMAAPRRRQILSPDENGLFTGDPRCDSTATDFRAPKEAS